MSGIVQSSWLASVWYRIPTTLSMSSQCGALLCVLLGVRNTPQHEHECKIGSSSCVILRRRGSMHMRCLDGVGRESWDWEVAYVLASPLSPRKGGNVPVR